MGPTAGVFNGFPPPDSGGSVEIEESTRAVSCGMLDDEVTVQQQGLDPRQPVVIAVDVTPSGLHHADGWIVEAAHAAAEEVGLGDKISVEDGHEWGRVECKSVAERARLVARPDWTSDVRDGDAAGCPMPHSVRHNRCRPVCAVVQDLDPELRPIEARNRIDQPGRDGRFVVQRELNHHGVIGLVGPRRGRIGGMQPTQQNEPVQPPQNQCAEAGGIRQRDQRRKRHQESRVAQPGLDDTHSKTGQRSLGAVICSRYHLGTAWRVFRTDRLAPVFSIWEPALAVDGMPL